MVSQMFNAHAQVTEKYVDEISELREQVNKTSIEAQDKMRKGASEEDVAEVSKRQSELEKALIQKEDELYSELEEEKKRLHVVSSDYKRSHVKHRSEAKADEKLEEMREKGAMLREEISTISTSISRLEMERTRLEEEGHEDVSNSCSLCEYALIRCY